MWLKKLQHSLKINKGFLTFILGSVLAGATLLYPLAIFYFNESFSPLYLARLLVCLLLIRSLLMLLMPSKKEPSPFRKNTALLTLGAALIFSVFLFFKGDIAALYYPVIMNLSMAGLFGFSLFFPPSLIERLARLKDPALTPSGIKYTKQVTKIWVGFCFSNALISYMTILTNDLKIWTLYNGFISYIFMGILLGGEILFRPYFKKKSAARALKNFTTLSGLLKKDDAFWKKYWGENTTNYQGQIEALSQKISQSKAQRVFLISHDRAIFFKGLLAILKGKKTVVLPQTNTPDLLKALLQKGDFILSDQGNLKELTPHFIDLNTKGTIATNAPVSLDENAEIIFYTSGSTGSPQPIYKTLRQLETEVLELQKTWPLNACSDTTLYATVPPHHIYGFLFSVLWPLCSNTRIAAKSINHWEELPCDESLILISSPAHLGRFPENFYLKAQEVFSSGGPLSFQNALKSKAVLGVLPTEVYGSTETGGIAYRQQKDNASPWTIFPALKIRTTKESKLLVKSPYLNTDEFYETSDLVALKNKGQFTLKGRSDRIIKIEEKRICLIELEKKLCCSPLIKEAHTFLLDTKNRQEISAFIVLTSEGLDALNTLGKFKLTQQIRRSLQSYFDLVALPRRWRFTDILPQNSQGKRPMSFLTKTFLEKESS